MKRITDFRNLLSGTLSRKIIDDIVESVHHHPEDFKRIYELMGDEKTAVSWRAAWACQKIAELHPEWYGGKQRELTDRFLSCRHDGTKRILLSIIYDLPAESPFPVDLLDYCFDKMFAPEEPIAVQSLCIKTAYKLCKLEPELLPELKLHLENAELAYYSTAVKSCARKVLKGLR